MKDKTKTPGIILRHTYFNVFEILTDEQLGSFVRFLMEYASSTNGDKPNIQDRESLILFKSIQPQIDRDIDKYRTVVERNRKNGLKGGRPPNNPKKPR